MIFLTALTDTVDKLRAFDMGGVDYITKPFQFEEVLARVNTHVTLRRAQVALAESYERLRTLEQLRDDLVHMIVHDMRSPLQVLLVQPRAAGRARRGARRRQPPRSADRDRVEQGARPDGQHLLDVSRLEAGKLPLERASWDLTRMADEVRAALGTWTARRRIEVESPGAVDVSCDGSLVRRIMENLVSNAIKHTPAGTHDPHFDRPRRRPRACRGARQGGRCAAASQSEDLREVRDRREPTRTGLSLRRAGSRVLQARHRGPWRDHRRGSRCARGSTFWFELPG